MLARIFTLTSNSPSSATAASTSCRCSRAALRCSSVRANAPASSCVGSDGAPITSGMKKPEPSRSLSTRTRSSIGIISSPGPVLITPIWPRAPCARSQAVNWVSLIWRSVLVPMPTRTWMRSRSSSVKGIGVGSLPSSHDDRPPDRRPLGLGHCRECEERGPAAPIRSQDGEAPLLIVLRYDNLGVQIPDHDAADVGRLARDLECLDQEPRLSVLGDVGGVLVARQRDLIGVVAELGQPDLLVGVAVLGHDVAVLADAIEGKEARVRVPRAGQAALGRSWGAVWRVRKAAQVRGDCVEVALGLAAIQAVQPLKVSQIVHGLTRLAESGRAQCAQHRQRCRVTRLRTRMAGLQNGQVLVRCDVPCTCLTRQVLFVPQLICLNLALIAGRHGLHERLELDRKSTRLNSSHVAISYAILCSKKKKKTTDVSSAEQNNWKHEQNIQYTHLY